MQVIKFLLRPIKYVYHAVKSTIEIIQVESEHEEWIMQEYEKARKEREKQ